jgi:formylglycine-generating enzyme required for sulfatase activity
MIESAQQYDKISVNRDAAGFRLPSSNEWDVAARYINGKKYYLGEFASGSDAPVLEKATSDYDGNGKILSGKDILYAENDPESYPKRYPNKLGIYGMTGGNSEWCDGEYQDETEVIAPEKKISDREGDTIGDNINRAESETPGLIKLIILLLAIIILFLFIRNKIKYKSK